jgi:hypothetical protein
MAKVLHEDLETISNLLMFANPQAVFAMFLLCYALCPDYLLHIMFPSLGILQHYIEFDTHTIVTFKKLLGEGSFNGSISHLARC